MKSLQEILSSLNLNISTNPRGTDKGDFKSYVDHYYQENFKTLQKTPVALLEIGFRHGASLALWSAFFEQGKIFGVDNLSDESLTPENSISHDWINRSNVEVFYGDAYDKKFSDTLKGPYDIIIEDGPHWLDTQQKAIELYLCKLSPNGTFIIEDVLSAGLAIFPLLSKVPLRYSCKFYDFRHIKSAPDDCLFIITPERDVVRALLARILIILEGIKYLVFSIFTAINMKLKGIW